MIDISNLSFRYDDNRNAVDNISISIDHGERIGIIGPNGAGKTTLFHLMCGILTPACGSIIINSKPVIPNQFNRDIGYIFQNPEDQLFNPSVYEDVTFGLHNLNIPQADIESYAEEALEMTGCLHLKRRPPHHLSGGEKRMVSIATVIAMRPEILIYDEPTSGLDMRSRRTIISFISRSDVTNLISSHDMEFILEVCNRIILLDSGCLIADGSASSIMQDSELLNAHGIEQPFSMKPAYGRDMTARFI